MMSALHRIALLLSAASLCFLLESCSSSPSGLPRNLPPINLHGSAATPPHSMEKKDYPFDANGNYVTSWAALAGAPANDADYDSWRSSHGDGRSRKQPSTVQKYTASKKSKDSSSGSSKSKTSTGSKTKSASDDKPKSKSGSGSSKPKADSDDKPKAKSSSGSSKPKGDSDDKPKAKDSSSGSHTVKSSDTLSSIAREHHTTVSKLKAANGLKSDVIVDGKKLKIPK